MESKTTEWRAGPNVCRCCLTEGCYKDISTEYFWMGKREVYAEMLTNTLDVSIAYSQAGGPNSNSRLICELCISRLRDASDFKRQVLECEKTFMQHLDAGSSAIADVEVQVESIDSDVKLERVKQEKQLSDDDDDFEERCGFDDDDDDDDLDDEPLTKLASKIPKKESVDLLDLLDNTKATAKRKSTTKTKSVAAKKSKTVKKEPIKAGASKLPGASKLAAAKTEKKKKGPVIWTRLSRKYNDHRDNAAIILESSNACPFRWRRGAFTCASCPSSFADFSEVKEHSKEHKNCNEAIRKARPFSNVKIEVTELRCELCLMRMTGLDTLCDHLIENHNKPIITKIGIGVTPYYLTGKEYKCTHCDETFLLFSKLNSHLNTHYPNSICFQCGKAFSSVPRLKSHLLTHDSAATTQYNCTRCDQTFPTRVLKNNHISQKHGPEYRYRCPYCKDTFKSYADRGKHLKTAHDKKIEYPCNLCPAVFAMCNQRTKHVRQVHMGIKSFACEFCSYKFVTAAQLRNHMIKHGGERKYQCQVCKKAYARTKTLREHMRIHNNDKRFVCQYCNTAFVQKCSLQSHLRTHHPTQQST